MKKRSTIISLIGMFIIFTAIPATIFLTQQNQEIREKAEETGDVTVCYNDVTCQYNYGAGQNPQALQQAINGVTNGGTVIIERGDYYIGSGMETLGKVQDKSISIRGYSSEKTRLIGLINGSPASNAYGLILNGSNIIIYSLTITDFDRGGIKAQGAGIDIYQVKILNSGREGEGGIYFKDTISSVIRNTIISSGGMGIALEQTNLTNIDITNSIIINNSGCGIFAYIGFPNANIINNVISGNGINSPFCKDGILISEPFAGQIKNNIIVNNTGYGINRLDHDTGISSFINYNDVNGNSLGSYNNLGNAGGGTGNISEPPLFVDPPSINYELQVSSLAIDAGDPSLSELGDPVTGNALPPAKGSVRSDMGAFGGPGAYSWKETPPPLGNKLYVCNWDQYPEDCEYIEESDFHWSAATNPQAIQKAIDSVEEGGEIVVKRGVYEMQPDPDISAIGFMNGKDLKIRGEGSGITVLKNARNGFVTYNEALLEVSNMTISNMTDSGIRITGDSYGSIIGCVLDDNGSEENYGGAAGWNIMLSEATSVTIKNNIIKRSFWEGIIVNNSENINIINNTFVENYGNFRPGGISIYGNSSANIINNIIVNNQDKGIYMDESVTGTVINKYNNVWHNYVYGIEQNWIGIDPGIGSISYDPLFTDDVYHIDAQSPSVDSGDPEICDFDGSKSDMGVYGGGGVCGSSSVNLQVKIRLEKKNDHTNYGLRVKLVQIGGATVKNVQDFNTDASGISNVINIGVIPNGQYEVYVKPNQYISKMKTVTISEVNTIIDFSDFSFRAGDLSHSSYDFLNSLDFSQFIMYFRMDNDVAEKKLGDLNQDGAVNSVDYSIMIKTYREESKGYLVLDPI